MNTAEIRKKIRELNDAFRTTLDSRLGRVMMTAGVDALRSDVKAMVIRRVAMFSDFTADNDPHGEHDFGSFEAGGRKIFFKLDLLRSDADVRLGRSGRCEQNDAGADDYARGGVLTCAAPLMLGGFLFAVERGSVDE